MENSYWKRIQNLLKPPRKFTVKKSKPTQHTRARSVLSGHIAQQVLKVRLGSSSGREVPTLGKFKTSTMRYNPSLKQVVVDSKFASGPNLAVSFLNQSPGQIRHTQTSRKFQQEKKKGPKYLGSGERHLPLDYFVIEQEKPESLLERGKLAGDGICMGRTIYKNNQGKVSWVPTQILFFDRPSKRFHIRIMGDGCLKFVRRYNLVFEIEDQQEFFRKREEAIQERHATRKRITTELFIGTILSQIFETDGMDQKTLEGVFEKLGLTAKKYSKQSVDEYLLQIHALHDYAILKGIYYWLQDDPRVLEAKGSLQINGQPPPVYKDQGKVSVFQEYPAVRLKIQKEALIADSFWMKCSLLQREVYQKTIETRELFEFPFSVLNRGEFDQLEFPIQISKFLQMQKRVINNYQKAVHGFWVVQTSEKLRLYLSSRVNFDDDSQEYSQLPRRLRRFFSYLRYKMEGEASSALQRGLRKYKDFLMGFAVRNSALLDNEILIPARDSPILQIRIISYKNKIRSRPSLKQIERGLKSIPNLMVNSLKTIETVQAWLFPTAYDLYYQTLPQISLQKHPVCQSISLQIQQIVTRGLSFVYRILKGLQKFQYFLTTSIQTVWNMVDNDYQPKQPPMYPRQELFYRILSQLYKDLTLDYWELKGNYIQYYDFGVFSVNCSQAKQKLLQAGEVLMKSIEQEFLQDATESIRIQHSHFSQMKNIVAAPCYSIDQVSRTIDYMASSVNTINELKKNISIAQQKFQVLYSLLIPLDTQTLSKYFQLYHWPVHLQKYFKLRKSQLAEANQRLIKEMQDQKLRVRQQISEVQAKLQHFKTHGLHEKKLTSKYVKQITGQARALKTKLKQLRQQTEIINRRENIIGMKQSRYRELFDLIHSSNIYFELWETAFEMYHFFPLWFDQPLIQLDIENISQSVLAWMKTISRLEQIFQNTPRQKKVLLFLSNKLEDFKEYIPLISALTTPGLRERHWKEIRATLSVDISSQLSFSLRQMIKLELHQQENLDILVEISERASKEMTIEQTLDTLEQEWYKKEFSMMMYKGLWILTKADDVQMQVDQHSMKIQTLKASAFVGPFKERVFEWEKTLKLMTELLNEWVRVNRYWIYLEPIFSSSDLARQMRNESAKFEVVDTDLKRLLEIIHNNPSIMACADNDMFYTYFSQCNQECEKIIKSLRQYLDKKRAIFPRFYFLSDDEMLDLLSHANNQKSIQKQIHKCFHGIASLIFDRAQNVCGMRSLDKQEVRFNQRVNVNVALEDWLQQVREKMVSSLRSLVFQRIATHKKKYNLWPNQVNIISQKVEFTRIVSSILKNQGFQALFQEYVNQQDEVIDVPRRNAPKSRFFEQFLRRIEKETNIVIELVRSSVKKRLRNSYSNHAMVLIHQRDSLDEIISCNHEKEFNWQIQVRHSIKDGKLNIECMSIVFPYCFEYLGTAERLVITNLTQRAQRCLLLAMQLRYAGSPQGPAGTGKTETTKQLARIVGVHCIVFNCSDELDSQSMAQFFKGMAICGAWSCFDQFNRIDQEVLSIISQQILTVTLALRAGQKDLNFQGSDLKLNPCFSVYITMNPAYRGRTQLPDSLKNLLRPIAMVEPENTMIAQISLYSCGFEVSRTLSKKIIAVLKLCQEQLSTQGHYDFGLRNLKSILKSASRLRTQNSQSRKTQTGNSEQGTRKSVRYDLQQMDSLTLKFQQELIVKAIISCNKPKLVGKDIIIFHNIIQDVFRSVGPIQQSDTFLHKAMTELIRQYKLSENEAFCQKIFQVYDTLKVRHGIMLIGDPMSGKSTTLKLLYQTLNRLKVNQIMDKVMMWSQKEATQQDFQHYKSIIFTFKELQVDVDEIEQEKLLGQFQFLSIQRLKQLRNRCQYSGVTRYNINPKAYPLSRLFGSFDEQTRQWHDGLISSILRRFMLDDSKRLKWLVFDGPIDSQWAQNLNTALDDNKKLCLISGETILVNQEMNIIFQVDSLQNSSPATVSRLGMIYFDYKYLPPLDIFQRYTQKEMPEVIREYGPKLSQLFEWLVIPSLKILSLCQLNFPIIDHWMLGCLVKLLDNLLDDYRQQEMIETLTAPQMPGTLLQGMENVSIKAAGHIEASFIIAVIWTFGAALAQNKDRKSFDAFVKERVGILDPAQEIPGLSTAKKLVEEQVEYFSIKTNPEQRPQFMTPLKKELSIFDIFYDKQRRDWIPWEEKMMQEFQNAEPTELLVTQKSPNTQVIIVPTVDVMRNSYFLQIFSNTRQSVLIAGPTGTGKSVLIKGFTKKRLQQTDVIPILISFTSQTSYLTIQKRIETKVEKFRKGVLSGHLGKSVVIIAEDINMTAQKGTSQPTLEFIRQWFDHGGWYDTKYSDYWKVENLYFIATMTPKFGSSKFISLRILRHFTLFTLTEESEKTFHQIFGTIFSQICGKFPQRATRGLEARVVQATFDIYKRVKKKFKPTPIRPHYRFNIRDATSLFKGMSICNTKTIRKKQHLIRLWYHQTLRTFYDRLVDYTDRVKFFRLLDSVTVDNFQSVAYSVVESEIPEQEGETPEQIEKQAQAIIKSKIVPVYGIITTAGLHQYMEIKSVESSTQLMRNTLQKYNFEKSPMNLIIFKYVIQHLLIICRVIKSPQSHALLVGVGGSGKSALAKLAAFLFGQEHYSIQLRHQYHTEDWVDDLKKIIFTVGSGTDPGVFVIDQSQIIHQEFLEYIHNFLNSGQIPNLFSTDEMSDIIGKTGGASQNERLKSWMKFVNKCKDNLTLVICISPIGNKFRQRIRSYPGLVNCTVIDWFLDTPQEGLLSVGQYMIEQIKEIPENLYQSLARAFVRVYCNIREKSKQLGSQEGRHIYTTPVQFLDLVNTFKSLLASKRENIELMKRRYETSVEVLQNIKQDLKELQSSLKQQETELSTNEHQLKNILKVIQQQGYDLSSQQEIIAKEEAIISQQAAQAEEIRQQCQAAIDKVLPELESAKLAIKSLSKSDISQLKTLNNPPLAVRIVMEALCVTLKVPPSRYKKSGVFVQDYWMASMGKKVLGNPKLLNKLLNFNKDSLQKSTIEKLVKLVKNPEFKPEKAEFASVAAKGMCKWIRALVKFHFAQKQIKPKEKALAQAQKECSQLKKQLKHKKKLLSSVEKQLKGLIEEQTEKEVERKKIQTIMQKNKQKILRAQKLIGGLGGEMQRWNVTIRNLAVSLANLRGDMVMAAGFVTFLGPFPRQYRQDCISHWQKSITQQGLNSSQTFNLIQMLGDAVVIQNWVSNDLPNDPYSIQNAISIDCSLKYPICIDPQGEAYRWIRKTYPRSQVTRFSDQKFISLIETSIQFGLQVVIQIDEYIDPVILPLLSKQRQKIEYIRVTDTDLKFNRDFRLFMSTRLNNPNYLPEISSLIVLLNFQVTNDGLFQQILSVIVSAERKEMEDRHLALVKQSVFNKRQIKNLEIQIVNQLSDYVGEILQDQELVLHLHTLKSTSEDIANRLRNSKKLQKKIAQARKVYEGIARRSSQLFMSATAMGRIRHIYQFSLKWYIQNIRYVLRNPSYTTDQEKRVVFLLSSVTRHIFLKISDSLYQKDKLLFALLICFNIISQEEMMTLDPIEFLLGIGIYRIQESSPIPGFSDQAWSRIRELSDFYPFNNPPLYKSLQQDPELWIRTYQQTLTPQQQNVPGPYQSYFPTNTKRHQTRVQAKNQTNGQRLQKRKTLDVSLDDTTKKVFLIVQRLCILKCLKPQRLIQGYQQLVSTMLGPEYLESDPGSLINSYKQSSSTTPFLICHSFSHDPIQEIINLNHKLSLQKKIKSISMGAGMIKPALNMLAHAKHKGYWIILQNIHLCRSFWPVLQEQLQKIVLGKSHQDFRIWLTSSPTAKIPLGILQTCKKLTMEPVYGLKMSLLNLLNRVDSQLVQAQDLQRKLVFGLCFVHASIEERCRYGALGWSKRYEFTQSDFLASIALMMNLTKEALPWKMIKYCIADLTYGGRVSEEQDVKLLQALMEPVLNSKMLTHNYSVSEYPLIFIPQHVGSLRSMYWEIQALNLQETPEIYGLHQNQAVFLAKIQGERILESIAHIKKCALLLEDMDYKEKSGVSDQISTIQRGEFLQKITQQILQKLQENFDYESVSEKYPVIYQESLNIVLQQEIMRYNKLLVKIRTDSLALHRAASGKSLMSLDLQEIAAELLIEKVPSSWLLVSYPNSKPLAGYLHNLSQRLSFIATWIQNGHPKIFWFPGLFYPQAFLTALLQNYSRRNSLDLQSLTFSHEVSQQQGEGQAINGLFLEGARFEEYLEDALYREFCFEMPIIRFIPVQQRPKQGYFECPVYKTGLRSAPIGNNLITSVILPTVKPSSHWIRKAVALICENPYSLF